MIGRGVSTQLEIFRRAADEASASLSKWLGRPTTIAVRQVQALPLEEAAGILGESDLPLVACAMQISGVASGLLVLACDDPSGLALADMLLGRPAGGSSEWGEIERSAAIETANIIGCAYLGAVAASEPSAASVAVPSPPWFLRDYAAAVMESVILAQAGPTASVFLTRTEFTIDGSPVRCSLVFVPDAEAP
jgi:chemotaxis protein CheC